MWEGIRVAGRAEKDTPSAAHEHLPNATEVRERLRGVCSRPRMVIVLHDQASKQAHSTRGRFYDDDY
jgi:hypothetical protein